MTVSSIRRLLVAVLLLCAASALAVGTKGIGMTIKDQSGAQVGGYAESHALLIGVSDYTAGWPDLEAILGELIVGPPHPN